MSRLVRISSMVEGVPCVMMIDNEVKHYPVHEHGSKKTKYIKYKGRKFYEKDLPMGEEIIV